MAIENLDSTEGQESLPSKEKLSAWLQSKNLKSLAFFVDNISGKDLEELDSVIKEVDPESGIYRLTWAGASQQQRIVQILGELRTNKNQAQESKKYAVGELLAMLNG